jgi:hypothetical protein
MVSEKTASGNNSEEYALPGKEGLHALAEEMRRLADVNMTGVAVSIATFVRSRGLLASHSSADTTFIWRNSFLFYHQLLHPLSSIIFPPSPDLYLRLRGRCMPLQRLEDSPVSVVQRWRTVAVEVAFGSSLHVLAQLITISGERALVPLVGLLPPRDSIERCCLWTMVSPLLT